MKKILATMLVGVFALAAIAQTVVYDYKATFKRIDPVYKLRTLTVSGVKGQYVTESYGVKSDSITGYVVLPLCEECKEGTLDSSVAIDDAFAYLTRKGDKLTKKNWDGDTVLAPYVLKTPVFAKAAVFGKNVYTITSDSTSDPAVNVPKTMSAWMTLDYVVPTVEDAFLNPGHVIKKAASTEEQNLLTYGFLGLDNKYGTEDAADFDFGEGYVINKGFGKASVVTTSTPGSIGVCVSDPGSKSSCNIITSISGSVVGEFGYEGPCGTIPMWDLCDVSGYGVVNYAPIAGTWTLKYNKSMTNKGDTDAQEEAIQSKLGVAKATFIEDDGEIDDDNGDDDDNGNGDDDNGDDDDENGELD